MTRLLLVDGTNVVMRCASIQAAAPAVALEMACAIIRRAVRTVEATHLVVAFDAPGAGVRSTVYPAYKANRTTDTAGWVAAGTAACEAESMCCVAAPGYEADDVIATIAGRQRGLVEVLSGDSDLLALAASDVGVWQFDKAAPNGIARRSPEWICAKYGIPCPADLTLYKALVGEPGDNVPGMPKVGPVRARKMIAEFGDLQTMRKLGALGEHAEWIEKAVTLLTLYDFAPVPALERAATSVQRLTSRAAA
jgi:DNA polymerase-1